MENKIFNSRKNSVVIFLLLFVTNCLLHLGSSTVNGNINGKNVFNIIAVISSPKNSCTQLLPKWERGDEILPGAQIAVDEINSSPNLLSMHLLEIIPIKFDLCNPVTKIESLVGNITSAKTNVIAAIGYFCDNLVNFLSPILGHDPLGIIQISAMPAIASSGHSFSKYHHFLPSPTVLAKAATKLIQRLGINQIGVITNGLYHDTHYSKITEVFLHMVQTKGIKIVYQLKGVADSQNLIQSDARLVVVFLLPSEASDLICNVHLQGLKWPYYTWVYVQINRNELMNSTALCPKSSMIDALENVTFLHLKPWSNSEDFILTSSGNNYTTYYSNYLERLDESACIQNNPYANLLYDSVWAIALALNASKSTISPEVGYNKQDLEDKLSLVFFQGATGFVNLSQKSSPIAQISVGMYQVITGDTILIGSYDLSSDQLHLNINTTDIFPKSDFKCLYVLYPSYLTGLLTTCLCLLIIFTTITMSMFIHYRKTPKVKATSNVLSLCMFVGCYCLIFSSLIHTIASGLVVVNNVLRYACCWGNTFLYTVGIDLVLATVFAKTLRIYHIFNKFGKISSLWSDKALFVLILGVVSIKVAIMVIWGSVDMNHLIDETISSLQGFPPHYLVVQKCYSHHLSWWVTLTFGYTSVLFLPMLHLAVLTRKIKRSEFKESKQICVLIAILFLLMCIGTSLWFLLRAINEHIASKVVYSLGFSSAAVVCQIFLFVPKITPPMLAQKMISLKDKLRLVITRPNKGYSYRRINQTQQ